MAKKEMLPRYYELANNELGMQEVYNENENLFNFIKNINNLINSANKTINVNGQTISIIDYKVYLNNQILLENKYMEHDRQTIFNASIGVFITVLLAFVNNMVDKGADSVRLYIIPIIYMVVIAILYDKVSFFNRRSHMNNVGFYQLVLNIINEI